MKIEVKKVQFGPDRLSQETLNFVCDVYADGVKIGYAENQGHGGCTNVSWERPEQRELFKKVEEWAKGQPPIPFGEELGGGSYPNSLDNMVDILIDEIYNQKQREKAVKSLMRSTKQAIVIANLSTFADNGRYRWIKYKFDFEQVLNRDKNPKAIEAVKKSIREALLNLQDGETIINENIANLVKEVKEELAVKA